MAEEIPRISRQYQSRINEVITYLTANRAALTAQSGDAAYRLALQHARVLLLGMTQAGIVDADAGMEYRDNYMAQNVKWIVEHGNNAKVMALAHNGHIQKAQTGGVKKPCEVDGLSPSESVRQPLLRAGIHVQPRWFRAGADNGSIRSFTVRPYPGSLTVAFSAFQNPLFFMDIASLSQNPPITGVLNQSYFFYNAAATYDDNAADAGGAYNLAQSYDGVIHVDRTTPATGL